MAAVWRPARPTPHVLDSRFCHSVLGRWSFGSSVSWPCTTRTIAGWSAAASSGWDPHSKIGAHANAGSTPNCCSTEIWGTTSKNGRITKLVSMQYSLPLFLPNTHSTHQIYARTGKGSTNQFEENVSVICEMDIHIYRTSIVLFFLDTKIKTCWTSSHVQYSYFVGRSVNIGGSLLRNRSGVFFPWSFR